jgi:hypothetical protein
MSRRVVYSDIVALSVDDALHVCPYATLVAEMCGMLCLRRKAPWCGDTSYQHVMLAKFLHQKGIYLRETIHRMTQSDMSHVFTSNSHKIGSRILKVVEPTECSCNRVMI